MNNELQEIVKILKSIETILTVMNIVISFMAGSFFVKILKGEK